MTSLLLQCQSFFLFGCIFFFLEDYTVLADVTCYNEYDKGMTYNGTVNVSVYGKSCKNWKLYHSNYTYYYPDHNYCRNPRPDSFRLPWCYTGDNSKFEMCNILICDCRDSRNDLNYNGTISTSIYGETCLSWSRAMSYQTETSNYCRTPENDNDNAGGPWCYVNETRGWNRCNIPVCGGAVCPALLGNLETLDRKHRYQYGESVILSCKLGYKLIGNRYLTCLPSGQWNDTIPRCDVLCSNNPCKNGGTCTDGVKGHTCTCRDNNFGINCQYDIVKCSNNPCKHGGTCTDGVKGHTCTCRDNNFGINCQYDISQCHNVTCLNGGICKEEPNGNPFCICLRGYSGKFCAQEPTIKVAPQIILKDKMTVDEGSSNSRIPCFAEGIPLPIIKWQSMTKTTLPSNARQLLDFLVFENVTITDSGMFICTARNEIGTDVQVIRLIVKAKPGILHSGPVIHALSTVKVDYYTDAKLVCNVTGFPTPTVTWKHGNKLLHTSGNLMVVQNVTNTTAGQYTCIATNDVGTSQVNIFLEVTYDTPKILIHPRTAFVMIGQSHNFTCFATGHPKPSLTWSYKTFAQESTILPSHQLIQGGQVLTLFALKTFESGTLTCAAENAFGVDRASVTVIFKNPDTTGFG